ncbi:MAG TPA: hypothetical protein VIL43_08245 [Burkholderiales bacterium]
MSELPRDDDEALSALIDGSLPAEQAAALEARLEREPQLAARFEAMRRADRAVRDAYRAVVEEPLPERVLDLLRERRGGADDRVAALERRPRRSPPAWWPHALAAGIALAVGIGLGFGLGRRAGEPPTLLAAPAPVPAGSALYELLESAPSGIPTPIDGAATAEVRFTFKAQDGDWCRELSVTAPAATNAAVACRRAGVWRVELVGAAAVAGETYRPADAESPFREAVDALIEGEPLEPGAERELLANGWPSG